MTRVATITTLQSKKIICSYEDDIRMDNPYNIHPCQYTIFVSTMCAGVYQYRVSCIVRVVIELIAKQTTVLYIYICIFHCKMCTPFRCCRSPINGQDRMVGWSDEWFEHADIMSVCAFVRERGTKFHARIQFSHDRMARFTDFVFYYKYDYTLECVVYESG